MKRKGTSRWVDILIGVLLLLVALCMVFPFIYVFSVSFMTTKEYLQGGITLLPTQGITLQAYKALFSTPTIFISYKNTLFLVFAGTALSLVVTTVTSYALSRSNLKGKSVILFAYILTMLINGGIVPNYVLVRQLGLINNLWSMIFPVTVNTYFMIILKTFFLSIPDSLEESAYIDGCNEVMIMVRIFIPLSLPAMATIGLFYAVNYWNSFFLGVMYLTDKSKWPLQLLLRDLIVTNDLDSNYNVTSIGEDISSALRMATIVVSVVPILCVYPFLQKYFVKGVMIGAVKG